MAIAATVLTTFGAGGRRARPRNRRTPPAPTGTAAGSDAMPAGTIPDPAACAEGLTLEDGVLTVATGEPAFPPVRHRRRSRRAAKGSSRRSPTRSPSSWVRARRRRVGAHAVRRGDRTRVRRTSTSTSSSTASRPSARRSCRSACPTTRATTRWSPSPTTPGCRSDHAARAAGAPTSAWPPGRTSLQFVEDVIAARRRRRRSSTTTPTAVQAMSTQQIDAIVVDLPTALYLTAVELEGGVVVGQFPPVDTGRGRAVGSALRAGQPARRVRRLRDPAPARVR